MPLNTPVNDLPLPGSTTELPQSTPEWPRGTSAEDTLFELHIRDRVIVNSMVNFLKGVLDAYISEHAFLLLRSTLTLMLDVPTTAAYLQENENDGRPIFVWLLDTAANIHRTSEGSRVKHTYMPSSSASWMGLTRIIDPNRAVSIRSNILGSIITRPSSSLYSAWFYVASVVQRTTL